MASTIEQIAKRSKLSGFHSIHGHIGHSTKSIYYSMQNDIMQERESVFHYENMISDDCDVFELDNNTIILHIYSWDCVNKHIQLDVGFIKHLLQLGARFFTCLSTGESAVFYIPSDIIKSLDINYTTDTFNDITKLLHVQSRNFLFDTLRYDTICEYLLYLHSYTEQNYCYDIFTFILCHLTENEPYEFYEYLIEHGANLFYISPYGETLIGALILPRLHNEEGLAKLDALLTKYATGTILQIDQIDNFDEICSITKDSSLLLRNIVDNSKRALNYYH